MSLAAQAPLQANASPPSVELDSVFEMVLNGGPLMVPIALCSVVALAYAVERSIRLREGELGSRRLARRIADAASGSGAAEALTLCRAEARPMCRVIAAGLERVGGSLVEVEKAVEDAGRREVKRLTANLKPLVVIGMIAPLLGLLGTVWGMIEAFTSIALQDGLGKPELLASGISQALITTAAGLTVAIPTQALYFWFRGRIDRFVRRTEDLYLELEQGLLSQRFPRLAGGGVA